MNQSQSYDEILCNSMTGILRMLAVSAFHQFEKTPRERSGMALNVLLARAKDRGYANGEDFKWYFAGNGADEVRSGRLLAELKWYLTVADINLIFEYIREG